MCIRDSYTADDIITVIELPEVTLDLNMDEACEDLHGINLEGGMPAGGTWSGPGVSGNYFDISVAGEGVHEIIYEYTNFTTGCSNTATQDLIIYGLPAVELEFALNQACIASNTFLLDEGIPAGGTYTGQGVTGNNFDASAAGLGVHTITYSLTDANGCANSSTATIEVLTLPVVDFILPQTNFCLNEPNPTLSGGSPAGGIYSGTGVTGNLLDLNTICLLYTSPSPRDATLSRMPSSA